MKKGGCALLGCVTGIGLLVLATFVVEQLAGLAVQAEPAPARPPERLREVQEDPESFRLTYRFRDADEEWREVSCTIRRADVERERKGFGFYRRQMMQEMNRATLERLQREAVDRGVARYFTIEVLEDGSFRWKWEYPAGTPAAVTRQVEAFHAWLDNEAPAALEPLQARFYREHGLRLENDTVSIDYAAMTRNATAPLADCFQALRRLDGSRAPVGVFLTFFQDLRYELPADVDPDGRETLGFRVPTAVMVQGAGDCDSKSAAFCALWRQLPARSLLVLVPGHALVAVEGRPGPDQKSIRLGNRTYILCEVAGPGRLPPGETDIKGSFEYILIEPAG